MTNIICKLIGHNSKKYLQVTETSFGEIWLDNGKNITKKIHTYFLCKRCHHSYKYSQIYCKEEHRNPVND